MKVSDRMHTKANVSLYASDDPQALGFGRGIAQLLRGIERTGSINQAAKEMEMAYSRAWKILTTTEREFEVSLLARNGRHGSELTQDALALLELYERARAAAKSAADEQLAIGFRNAADENN